MKFTTIPHTATTGLVAAALLVGAAASATATPRSRTTSATASTAAAVEAGNPADADFTRMMIPHHHQALVMSKMAPTRSGDDAVQAMASRIDIEQFLEISMMQGWQGWNGLEVTDDAQAYQMMLGMPAMLESMGMATPQELDELEASSGTAFDILYLELMIEHHEGAIDMLVDVIINGDDFILEGWATDMLTTQTTQIQQMQAMLDDLS